MVKKPVFGLAGAFLAGLALTGCQNTSSTKPFTPSGSSVVQGRGPAGRPGGMDMARQPYPSGGLPAHSSGGLSQAGTGGMGSTGMGSGGMGTPGMGTSGMGPGGMGTGGLSSGGMGTTGTGSPRGTSGGFTTTNSHSSHPASVPYNLNSPAPGQTSTTSNSFGSPSTTGGPLRSGGSSLTPAAERSPAPTGLGSGPRDAFPPQAAPGASSAAGFPQENLSIQPAPRPTTTTTYPDVPPAAPASGPTMGLPPSPPPLSPPGR
jgi:hypothetical protein